MHPLEHRLITQDPDLPGLALLHDDDALSAALRTHDPGIHRARVHYLRYKPHTHCLAALHLGGRRKAREYLAQALAADAAHRKSKELLELIR